MNWTKLFKRFAKPEIPGGWKLGSDCLFTHPEKNGLLESRVVGKIIGYDDMTNVISIEHKGRIYRMAHTTEFGGISGVPPTKKLPVIGDTAAMVAIARKASLSMSRQDRLKATKKFFLDNFVEDPIDGTEFDCAVLDAFETLESRFGGSK